MSRINNDILKNTLLMKAEQIGKVADEIAVLMPGAGVATASLNQVLFKLIEAKLWTLNTAGLLQGQDDAVQPEQPKTQTANPVTDNAKTDDKTN